MRRRDESSRRRIESTQGATWAPRTRSSPSSLRPRVACLPLQAVGADPPLVSMRWMYPTLLNVPPVPVVALCLEAVAGNVLGAGRRRRPLQRAEPVPSRCPLSSSSKCRPLERALTSPDADRCAARSVQYGDRPAAAVRVDRAAISRCIRTSLLAAAPRSVACTIFVPGSDDVSIVRRLRRHGELGSGRSLDSALCVDRRRMRIRPPCRPRWQDAAEPINNEAATAAVADRLARSRRPMTSPIFSGAGERGRSVPDEQKRAELHP